MTDATKLIGSHLAIIGNSGSGKSYTIRNLMEASWGQAAHVLFDVEDEFHTLRESFPYVLVGGNYADIELPRTAAAIKALALRVLATGTSVILQINDLDIPKRQLFIAAFLDALMAAPREDWRRMLIVIDEADKYAPQAGVCPSSQPIINLMAQGRKRGFVGVLATQRAAKINKSAISEASNWMIGRVGSTNDRRVASDQLGFKMSAPEMEALRTLPVGEFWRAGPAWGGRVLKRVPLSKTRHLQLGQTWAPPALDASEIEALKPQPIPVLAYQPPGGSGTATSNAIAGLFGVVLALAMVAAAFFWVKSALGVVI